MARKAKILIVDPERLLVDLLKRTLDSDSCEVIQASSVPEGRGILQSETPDLILIDPRTFGGMQLIREIQSDPDATPVLALTSSSLHQRFVEQAGIRTLNKSDSLSELIDTIRGYLEMDLLRPPEEDHVLVVDDDDLILDSVSSFLTGHGYVVSKAATSEQGLHLLRQHPSIRAALLDIILPDRGGLETLREITNHNFHATVVVMSAVADSEIAQQARELGAFDYLLKPSAFSVIEASVSAAIADFEYRTGMD